MKNRLNRVKNFWKRHQLEIVCTAWFAAGVAVTYRVMTPTGPITEVLHLTVDQAQAMIENAENAVRFDLPRQIAYVIVDPSL
jgi:hypothetical protein